MRDMHAGPGLRVVRLRKRHRSVRARPRLVRPVPLQLDMDPSGCSSAATDSGSLVDAGAEAAVADGASETGAATGEAGTTPDAPILGDSEASASGCAANAGTLCTASAPYGVTCSTGNPFDSSIPMPDSSLGCTLSLAPALVGTAYFCCVQAFQ